MSKDLNDNDSGDDSVGNDDTGDRNNEDDFQQLPQVIQTHK